MLRKMSRDARTRSEESNGSSSSSSIVRQQQAQPTKIDGRHTIWPVAFLADGRHVVSGGEERKIRRWRVEDGREVGTPMDAGSAIFTIAVSRDGKWIVSGMISGWVMVWNVESHKKVGQFKGHSKRVCAVDVSPDATKIATGSEDKTACVRSLSTGERLFGPLEYDNSVVSAKFSPDGRLVATATWTLPSIRIFDSQNGRFLVNVPIQVNSPFNQSLTWASDSTQLFALSYDGTINRLDVLTGTVLSQWPIHSSDYPGCITLASNGRFIAVSANSSVSFWDPTTHKQIGQVIQDSHFVQSMAVSSNGLATGGHKTITFRSLRDILPSPYCDHIPPGQGVEPTRDENPIQHPGRQISGGEPVPNDPPPRLPRTRQSTHNPSPSQSNPLPERRPTLHTGHEDPDERITNPEETIRELRQELATSKRAANREKKSLNEAIQSLRVEGRNLNDKVMHLQETVQELQTELAESRRDADTLGQLLRAHEQKHHCEALYTEGRIIDTGRFLLEITNTASEDVRADKLITDWRAEFTNRCVLTLEIIGDEASRTEKYDEALAAYSIALSLGPKISNTVLVKWTRLMLIRSSTNETIGAATEFNLPRFVICRVVCDVSEEEGCVTEAIECFRQMQNELEEDMGFHDERLQWELTFQQRCAERLERFGDIAMECQSYSEATERFSTVLSLDPVNRMDILIKRSQARASMNSWEEALSDADEAIGLDASCHRGYEMRHAALHGARRHAEAVKAFRTMLALLEESPYEHIRECRPRYVDAKPTIRRIVEQTIRHMPRVLIDTTTGRLYDKKQQAAAFEALPEYHELVSSMTTGLDHASILRAVKEFYRYVMLSHKWEDDEPPLQTVEQITVYKLESSLANVKLQKFCSLVRTLGFRWAWSDTCCVDKVSNVVLQESLVAMFTWYRGSSLTVVYLRGVSSEPQLPGGLQGSIWNTRAWTYQEYVAAETIQFYTEDWKPYLGLSLPNHKESPAIISEMQQATRVSAHELAVLRPGLERVREKLYLASKRQTTLVEDMAYSLLGIFNIAIPVIYGEGDRAVGRLLEHILSGSGDVTILAWTGHAGNYNSCLPVDLAVYNQLVPLHIPQPIEVVEMDSMVTTLRSSLPDLSSAVTMYNRLNELLPPSLTATRLRLPGIVFSLTKLVETSEPDPVTNVRRYHATTSTLGDIEIRTVDNLTKTKDLCLVHPWIRPLLDQEFSHGAAALDSATQALRFVARLRQPFGALLFEPLSRVEYRRVATDSLIMVQVREEAPLTDLSGNIRTIEVQ